MTEDGYTDLEREELKDASLNSLKVGTKENDLVRGYGAGRQLPLPYLPLPTLLIPPPWIVIPPPLPWAISRSSLGFIHLGILSTDSKFKYISHSIINSSIG